VSDFLVVEVRTQIHEQNMANWRAAQIRMRPVRGLAGLVWSYLLMLIGQ
jgi:hypothetical protein